MKDDYVYGISDSNPAQEIYSSEYEIKKEEDKDKAFIAFDRCFVFALKATEEMFLESAEGKLFAFTVLGENEYTYKIFMEYDFYQKHIGKLIKQQAEAELWKLKGRILVLDLYGA